MKLSLISARVLRALLDDPAVPKYLGATGYGLCAELSLANGSVWPVLRKLEAEGLVISENEQPGPAGLHRQARVYFRLTEAGVRYARDVLTELADQLRPPEPA
jgi:DNA-binding PadR family transcriptional regulator